MRKIWQKLTADRRRFGLFCGLLFVGLLLWARIIVIARPPRTAVADPHTDTKIEAVLTSDNQTIPVSLESEPMKNPFSVSEFVFPINLEVTNNNQSGTQEIAHSNETDFVASLKLEAVMGEMAMINGRVLKIGEVVGFGDTKNPLLLESVQGRTVILLAGNHRYELSIAPLHR